MELDQVMEPDQINNIGCFNELLDVWKSSIAWKASSYVALKDKDGLKLIFARVILCSAKQQLNEAPFTFESKRIVAGKEIEKIDPKEVDSFISNVAAGKLSLLASEVALSSSSSNNFSTAFFGSYHQLVMSGLRCPSFRVSGADLWPMLAQPGYKCYEELD